MAQFFISSPLLSCLRAARQFRAVAFATGVPTTEVNNISVAGNNTNTDFFGSVNLSIFRLFSFHRTVLIGKCNTAGVAMDGQNCHTIRSSKKYDFSVQFPLSSPKSCQSKRLSYHPASYYPTGNVFAPFVNLNDSPKRTIPADSEGRAFLSQIEGVNLTSFLISARPSESRVFSTSLRPLFEREKRARNVLHGKALNGVAGGRGE